MESGERIRKRRKELGITLEDLASALNKNRTTVARYEKGQIDKISPSTVTKIAHILRCSEAYLMGWTDDPSYIPNDDRTLWDDIVGTRNFTNEEIMQIIAFAKFLIDNRRENND